MSTPDRKETQGLPENPIITVQWGEPFTLPTPTLPESIDFDNWTKRTELVASYDLEIRGYKDQTLTGNVSVSGLLSVLRNPQAEIDGVYASRPYTITPLGSVDIEYRIVEDETTSVNRPKIVIAKLPLVISMKTDPSKEYNRDLDEIYHSIRAGDKLLRGKFGRVDKPWETPFSGWVDLDTNDQGTVYLPYDPSIFQEVKINIGGDRPQE